MLMMALCFSAFGIFSTAADGTADPTVYNDTSKLLCYAMDTLTGKSKDEAASNAEALLPVWLLARDIIDTKEYNEEYRNTGDCISSFSSDADSLSVIKDFAVSEYTDKVYNMYLDVLACDGDASSVLSKCLEIKSFVKVYEDLIVFSERTDVIIDFCETAIEKIKKDSDVYNRTLAQNIASFSALAKELNSARRATVLKKFPELNSLFLATSMGVGASERNLEHYRAIRRNYLVFCSAGEMLIGLTSKIDKVKDADELYFLLSGASYMIDAADKWDAKLTDAKAEYEMSLDRYNAKYLTHNEQFNTVNRIAGGIAIGCGVSPTKKKS